MFDRKMRRICWLPLLCYGMIFQVEGRLSDPKESVYNSYCDNVKKAHAMKARVHFDIQRMYTHVVTDPIKSSLETIYRIPTEDQLYSVADPLFMRSIATFSWDALLEKQKMNCIQTLKNSFTHFTSVNPAFTKQNVNNLRVLQTDSPQETRISIVPVESKVVNSIDHFVMPAELVSWHYAPSLWYPTPAQIGFPDDLDDVEMTQFEKGGPYGFTYTPKQLDANLLSYFGRACLNPDLSVSDLNCVLMIDSTTHACQSFKVSAAVAGQKRTLLILSNIGEIKTQGGLTIPHTMLINTNTVVDEDGNTEQDYINYFCQINLQGYTIQ